MTKRRPSLGLAPAAILALLATTLIGVGPATAQRIAVVVNGAAITELDIASRSRLLALSNQGRAPARTAVVDELIDERLKLLEARRQRVTVTDTQVDQAFGSIAERSRLQPAQLSAALQQRGVNPRTLRDRLRADLAWREVVQARAQRSVNIRDQDIVDAMRRRGQDPDRVRATEYRLAQVSVFGTSAERRRVAESLRASITSCANLRERVRTVRDAAARDPIRRTSGEFPPQLREILDRTAVGRSTPLQQGQQGFEFAVVCEKRDVPGRESASAEIRRELFSQEVEQTSTRLLREARERAIIERRR